MGGSIEQTRKSVNGVNGFQRTLRAFLAGLPKKHIVLAGTFLGRLVYYLDGRHRRIVRRNLRFVYPEWSPDRVRRHSRRVFQNLGITVLEILQISCFSKEDVLRNVRIRDKTNALNALKGPKGGILISGHLGNWEMGPLFVSCYHQQPLTLVARKIQPEILNRWVYRLRTRLGNILIDKEGALPQMTGGLRRGNTLGLLIDQGTSRSEGVEVNFFGRTVTATPAVSLLARRCNCPVIPTFCIREADGKLTLVVEPPLELEKTKDLRADLRKNTQIMNHAIEKAVKAYSDQWFWFHKRWKRHYPYLYTEDIAKRRRRKEKREGRMQKKVN